jgi:hypothetical protein
MTEGTDVKWAYSLLMAVLFVGNWSKSSEFLSSDL